MCTDFKIFEFLLIYYEFLSVEGSCQALLADVFIYVLHSCLIWIISWIRGILCHLIHILWFNSYCSFKSITYLRSHSLSLLTVISSINAHRYSYFIKISLCGTLCQLVWCLYLPPPIPTIYTFLYFHIGNICTCLIFLL